MVELGEVGEETPPVQPSRLRQVSDVQQGGNVQLGLRHTEGDLTVPGKYHRDNY